MKKDDHSGAMRMATQLEIRDHKDAAILQLHADRGMNAARDLFDSGKITRNGDAAELTRVLASRPDLEEKLDADPAYRAGFDALVWAKQHNTKAYDETIHQLDSRDRRSLQASISFQG